MKPRSEEQRKKLADDHRLLRAWRTWHAGQLAEARTGVHGALVAELMALLDKLELNSNSAAALLAFVERTDWSVINYEVRLELLHQLNTSICRAREARGLPPLDDPIPPRNDSVFRRVKARLLGSRSSGNAWPEAQPANVKQ